MKIGIMTFHASNNCGSMLQAYALQKTLENKFKAEVEIINFSNENQRDMYALFRKIDSFKDLRLNIVTGLFYTRFKTHYEDYREFLKDYLKLSKGDYHTSDELKEIVQQYDILITGSDQVWNILCRDADDAYYLNFAQNVKKIAYAPSFGATNILKVAKNVEKYKNYLEDFSALSCRENNGSKWIEELVGKEVPVLVDPTLLLDSEQWNCLIQNEEESVLEDGNYIFYYAFNYSEEVNKQVKMISEQLHMPVYILDVKSWIKKAAKFGFKVTRHSGPLEFLRLIKNAALVVTTSFHGTVFSLIYHKKFWFIDSKMHNKDDDRAYTLLHAVKMDDRMVKREEMGQVEVMQEVNYEEYENKIKQMKDKAINYLEEAIKD